MQLREESEQIAGEQSPGRHPRLRRWAVRRARQLTVAVVLVAGLTLLGACGVMIRRATCVIGLPDVGDPFDVAAFRSLRVPDDAEAFVVFLQAARKLRPMPEVPMRARQAGRTIAWSQAHPGLRAWLEANRQALAIFRQGALRADGTARTLINPGSSSLNDIDFGSFIWLAFLDASRLEEQGDMRAAWDGYRTILCTKVHIMRSGTASERYVADHFCQGLESRVGAWATNPKTDAALIRQALDDARANEPQAEWDAFSIKLDYLQFTSALDQPDGWAAQGPGEDQPIRIAGEPLPPNVAKFRYAARRYLINEPERSRRVLRLVVANWLAYVQQPDQARRKPSVRASFLFGAQTTHLSFFDPGPGAPAAARALSPQDLANWLITTRDAKTLLLRWFWPAIRISERRQHHALMVTLAEELYRRDHGSLPPTDEALVGSYLDHLPDDGAGELDDGTAVRIDESAAAEPGQPE